MSGSNRGGYIVAAIAVLVAFITLLGILTYTFQVGSADGYLDAESKQYQAEYAADTADRIESCSASTDPALLRECIEKAIAANHENQRNEKDLQAQRNMAEWAFWLLVISVIGVFVTGIGTGFLLWQIMLTREAVEDTGNATKAMQEANRIALNSAEKQLRAYVGFDDVTVVGLKQGGKFCFSAIVKNSGQTPAHDVQVICQPHCTQTNPNDGKILFRNTTFVGDMSSIVLNPDQHHIISNETLAPSPGFALDMVMNGTLHVLFAGIVSYRDIFGKRHLTSFKYFVSPEVLDHNGTGLLMACTNGNKSN